MRKKNFKMNDFDLKIKMCCASCTHKQLGRLMKTRKCTKRRSKFTPHFVCKDWQMSKAMRMMGCATGQVKRIEYLRFVLDIRCEEAEKGVKVPRSVESIRAEFEQEHGSIYINF